MRPDRKTLARWMDTVFWHLCAGALVIFAILLVFAPVLRLQIDLLVVAVAGAVAGLIGFHPGPGR